ncbi:hypothetical protein SLS56_001896 [Neofusicoccum ribis]|uniref:MFS general substrate transporter n=1 Tax=Neofusicoccum ribis TaxID=45134 RepID=A0ABR3T6E0_9PEZI
MTTGGPAEQQSEMLQESKTVASAAEKDLEGSTPLSTPPPSELEPVVTVKTWIVTCEDFQFLSFGYGLCFWPVPTVAAVGTLVSADFGQPNAYVWFVPAWTIATTVSFMIKYGVPVQLRNMAAFALPELLPNKWRHIGIILADGTVYITILVGPITARFGYEFGNWEWNFYGPAIFQFAAFIGLFFLYFPPAHPSGLPFMQAIKKVDYVGIVSFTAGCVPVLAGIVWAGIYESTDPHVVAPLVIGFFFLIVFGLWETYGGSEHPLAPAHIFASSWGRDFTAPCLALSITNMFYYSSSILWPTMTTVFYTNGGTDWRYNLVLSLPQGLAICFGAFLLFCFGSKIKHWQWQLVGSTFIVVLFGALLGLATPHNKGMMIAFLFISQAAFAWSVPLSIMLSQLGVKHKDLGISGGISGSLRFAGGAVATTVYQTIFNNQIAEWTPKLVVPAALKAGLDQSRVTELLSSLSSPDLSTLFSPDVVAAASEALKNAYCKGIFVVSMSSMGFGIVAIIACLSCKDVESKMTNTIDVYLENDKYADRNKLQHDR